MAYQYQTAQTQQAGPVESTYLPQPTYVATTPTTNSAGLTVGWIVAIITLVVLAMLLTYTFWNWRRTRNAGRYGQIESYQPAREYELQRPRAARVRDSIAAYRSGRYV